MSLLMFDVENENIIGLSLFAFALGLAVGVSSLAAAMVVAEMFVQVRRYRIYSKEVALVLCAEVIRILNEADDGVGRHKRLEINRALAHIARCLRNGPVEGSRYIDPVSRKVVMLRFRAAANAVAEYQGWISLQQESTVGDLRSAVERLIMVLSSEMYHYLPVGETAISHAVRGRSILGDTLYYTRKLTVACIPLLVALLLVPVFDIDIPTALHQWITGIGVILLVGQLIALLDPSLSWREFGEVLNASRKSSAGDRS